MDHFQENFYDAEKRQSIREYLHRKKKFNPFVLKSIPSGAKSTLNLSHRNMRSLDTAILTKFSHSTEYLDLSHNLIHSMAWIYEFPHLRCLIMDNNRLREAHFEHLKQPLPKIHTLMLNKNELSDLAATAVILQRLFPNVEYLSLHGNAMCPDKLLLQPFCEFVLYEYNHYRSILLKSLPNLKFLDHFSLNSCHHQKFETSKNEINEQQEQQQRTRYRDLSIVIPKNLWSKVQSFLTVNLRPTSAEFASFANDNSARYCASSSPGNCCGRRHSKDSQFITN